MEPMILAQIDKVSPTFLHQAALLFIGVLGGAASVAAIAGVVLKKRRLIEPQPLEVRPSAEYVTTAFCSQRHEQTSRGLMEVTEQVRRLWERLERDKESFEVSARTRSAGIYNKIDEIRKELADANTTTREEMSKGFRDVERALGRLEGEIKRAGKAEG
jgi:hypothetical protein